MHEVIDYINHTLYYLHQEYLNSGTTPEGEIKWKKNIVDLNVKMVTALGHGHEMHGNLSTILGNYGNITRAYRETILGSYATDMAGSATLWVPDDRLWEVGKGPDKDHRTFALRQYKNGFMMLANALAIGAFSSGGMLPVDGSIQYINNRLQLYFDEIWHDLAFMSDIPTPATITQTTENTTANGKHTHKLELELPSSNKYGIIEGGLITWLYGLTYSVNLTKYYINNVPYACPSTVFTLDAADATYPRIDVPAVTIDGTLVVVKGTPAENPLQPSVDVATQLGLPFILLPANATEPAGITDELVYNENVEWAISVFGVTVDFNNTTAPFNGAKCASVGTIGNNDTISFTAAEPLVAANYETLSMFLKLKAVASTKNAIYVQLRLAGVAVTQELPLSWSITDIVNWQNLSIKLSDFTFSNSQFDSIRIRWSRVQGTTEHAGFYLDYVKLQAGIVAPVFVDTVELTGDVIASGKTGTPIPTVLKNVITAGTFGSATKTLTVAIDAKGRVLAIAENNITAGTDGREVELSTSGGYIVWRYVGESVWNNLFPIPSDGTDGRGITSITLVSTVGLVKTYRITFTDSTTFDYEVTDGADGTAGSDIFQIDFIFDAAGTITYPCAYALKWTAMIYQQANAPTLSHALNTDLAQYTAFGVTADAAGIATLTGTWL